MPELLFVFGYESPEEWRTNRDQGTDFESSSAIWITASDEESALRTMTIARRQLIDVSVTRWYHCMSRCVRGASLLRSESSDRKAWLEDRIEELAQIFALGVGGFSVMDDQ